MTNLKSDHVKKNSNPGINNVLLKWLFILCLLFISMEKGKTQEELSYFLPGDVSYDHSIVTPEDFFQMQIGEWHLTYDQVLSYLKEIAETSDRAVLVEYARSYENRPLVHLIFTSAENHKNLEALKEIHYRYSEPGTEAIATSDVPLIINLGYGVHGNESSATNSSILTAYYLAAARGEKIDRLLNETIILVDPCLNPDGFTRHSTWANMHQSYANQLSPDSRQYYEVWPGGRTNHYWFDLNRDYLLLVHPESRGRVSKFHEWKPNVVTDHHEMDANSTFFFQPGVSTRNNPLTPAENYVLTNRIAGYHARFLDQTGSEYFTEEQFDDYYFGKGSSYPDINGSVGILFEQAGFRGRIRETANGTRTLAFGIRNQFTVTRSTLEASLDLKNELLEFQREFYHDALKLAAQDKVKAYIFGDEDDPEKTEKLCKLLTAHQIDVYQNPRTIEKDGHKYSPGKSYLVPTGQKQYRLIQSVFSVTTTFADSTFYDVSTWTLPHAFDVPFAELASEKETEARGEKWSAENREGIICGGKSSLGYLFRWNGYRSPEVLFMLQNAGLKTKVAKQGFSFTIAGKNENFSEGTIYIPANGQTADQDKIHLMIEKIARETGTDFFGLETGLSPQGIDMGSNNLVILEKPEVLILAGNGASSREAGEIWHLFDQEYNIPVCLTESSQVSQISLERYNTLILPGGTFSNLDNSTNQKIKTWVRDGGILIVNTSSTAWSVKNEISRLKFKKQAPKDTTKYLTYSERSKENSINAISGAIFKAGLDFSHPICYGYNRQEIPVFKTGTSVAEKLQEKNTGPVVFSKSPYLSGYVSDLNLERIRNSPVVTVESYGNGKVISFHENMTFRGIWKGTNKLLANAVFFGQIIR